jgi:hypothetical protein
MPKVFTAEFTSGVCLICNEQIKRGEQIQYGASRVPLHTSCVEDSAAEDESKEMKISWENTTGLDADVPEVGPVPLKRPVCQTCWTELPVSLVCGYCGS